MEAISARSMLIIESKGLWTVTSELGGPRVISLLGMFAWLGIVTRDLTWLISWRWRVQCQAADSVMLLQLCRRFEVYNSQHAASEIDVCTAILEKMEYDV